jgi:hypothetical protein
MTLSVAAWRGFGQLAIEQFDHVVLDRRVELGTANPEPLVEAFAHADVDLPFGVPFWHLVLMARVL